MTKCEGCGQLLADEEAGSLARALEYQRFRADQAEKLERNAATLAEVKVRDALRLAQRLEVADRALQLERDEILRLRAELALLRVERSGG